MPRFIKASYNEQTKTVEYIADNGDRLLRSGGTIAWRFNNPGNLRPGSKYKLHIGQGRTASGVFLIFPSPEAGREEKRGLLLRKYKGESIATMLYIYAPPIENDTERYISSVCRKTGLSRNQVVGELTDDGLTQLMNAMEEHEGFYQKKETRQEHWVRVTTIGFSDGAKPLVDMPVKIKRNGEEITTKTNSFGQLPPLIHRASDHTAELWIQDFERNWQKLETFLLGKVSEAHMFVANRLESSAFTRPHNPTSTDITKPHAFRYVVQPGDTLGKIAARFRIDAHKIQVDNHIRSPNRIIAGQVLCITKSKNASAYTDANVRAPHSRQTANDSFARANAQARSKEGKGHPIAIIPVDQKRAPWMMYALEEARKWAGKKEGEITKEQNYHKKVDPEHGLNTLAGNSNPWCASFVNWCLMEAGFQISHPPSSSQSFIRDNNFVKLDKPIYGAIVVWSNYVESTGRTDGTGHVGFLFGENAVLGGNQSDAINFKANSESSWHDKRKGRMLQKIHGYYVPLAYAEFARSEEGQRLSMSNETPRKLNMALGLSNAGVTTR